MYYIYLFNHSFSSHVEIQKHYEKVIGPKKKKLLFIYIFDQAIERTNDCTFYLLDYN